MYAITYVSASLSSPADYDTLLVNWNETNRPYFPSITKRSNGELPAVYYWNAVHARVDKGVIRMVGSSDNGATWSSATTIIDWTGQNLDVRDPHISTLNNGDLVLTFFSYRYEDTDNRVKGSHFCKSTTISLRKWVWRYWMPQM